MTERLFQNFGYEEVRAGQGCDINDINGVYIALCAIKSEIFENRVDKNLFMGNN
jgi:hypothetical protein